MGKYKRSDKSFTKEQKLIKENEGLKREISKLRKMLARIDLDRYSTIKDMIQDHRSGQTTEKTEDLLESMKQEWKCRDCSLGFLEIVIFSKLGNPWYFRSCNSCKKRTKSQSYDPIKVKGIVKNG